MIRLENVTKSFSSTEPPAVNDLTLEVKEGDTCVLVGPSGCGKTTTMKMINRLIEPTAGKIYINGKDSSSINPIKLRLGIGYVIQEIGLFPHMNIFENIATVPRELKWPGHKIKNRVDELLTMVGLEPNQFRNRKPKDLSGGQRQRVGVARCLAADPPIMLMDEPFGALDPITRAHLQNEFLRIQEKIKKTIVFVTHDIDEAIKMGTKIAVLRDGKLIQYSTPEELLSSPANEFVVNLVGGNYSIKRLHLIRVNEIIDKNPFTALPGGTKNKTEEILKSSKIGLVIITDDRKKIEGIIIPAYLKKDGETNEDIMEEPKITVGVGATLSDALSVMLTNGEGYAIVVDNQDKLEGVITLNGIMGVLQEDE